MFTRSKSPCRKCKSKEVWSFCRGVDKLSKWVKGCGRKQGKKCLLVIKIGKYICRLSNTKKNNSACINKLYKVLCCWGKFQQKRTNVYTCYSQIQYSIRIIILFSEKHKPTTLFCHILPDRLWELIVVVVVGKQTWPPWWLCWPPCTPQDKSVVPGGGAGPRRGHRGVVS